MAYHLPRPLHLLCTSLLLTLFCACGGHEVSRDNDQALALMQRGQYDEAITLLRGAVGREPSQPELWHNLAAAQHRKGELNAAVASMRRAYELDMENSDVRRALARLEFAVQDWAGLAKLYEHPGVVRDSTEDYLLPGLAIQRQGRARDALRVLRRGLEQFGDDPSLRLALASALVASDELESAQVEIDRAIELDPNAAGPYILLARVHRARDNINGVYEALGRLDRLPSRDPVERMQLGRLYLELDQHASAAHEFRYALQADPTLVDARLGHATAMYEQGQMGEAQQAAQELVRDLPDLAPAHALLGYIYASRQQRQLAVDTLTRALALDPEQPQAQQLLRQLQDQGGAQPQPPSTQGDRQ